MRQALLVSVLLFPASPLLVFGQACTVYTVVNAIDRRTGDEVPNLNPEDFEAKLGKEPLPVVSAEQNFSNRMLVLLQTDGTNNDRIEEVVSLATRLAREAPEGRQLAFGAFGKRSIFTKGFNGDPKKRAAEINAVIEDAPSLGKRIALWDALHNALSLFGTHQPGDTVMVVTDGYDDGSGRAGTEVEKQYLASGTRLLVMLRQTPSHVMGNFMWKNPELDLILLKRMSARTGGAYIMFNAYWFGMSWRGYMLGVDLPAKTGKSRNWKLRLQAGTRSARNRLNLLYPERLPPCAAGEQPLALDR